MSPVAFIIGSGPRVGASLAQHFLKEGYKVAVGSRNPDIDAVRKQGLTPVKIDVADHASITNAFAEVNKELGPANLVIFNGKSRIITSVGLTMTIACSWRS
jgi:NAD(P)-dependent dehydrogenase (short-subunit alcohol dehydrogenase family)